MIAVGAEFAQSDDLFVFIKIGDRYTVEAGHLVVAVTFEIPFNNYCLSFFYRSLDRPLQHCSGLVPVIKPANNLFQAVVLRSITLCIDRIFRKELFQFGPVFFSTRLRNTFQWFFS